MSIECVTIEEMKKAYPVRFMYVDWGRRPRGQGRRSGGMVMGGMSDVTVQGKKSYPDRGAQFGLEGEDAVEVNLLNVGEYIIYWKARTAGLSHDEAMTYAYTEAG